MIHLILNIFVLLIIILLIILVIFFKYYKHLMISEKLLDMLSQNLQVIERCNKLENVKRVRDSIFLISKLQIIAKISRSNFVTLFKYDQVNNNLFLHFIISMKNNGDIIHDSILLDLDNIPVTSSSFIQDILNSDDKKLYHMNLKSAKKNDYIYEKMLSKNIKNIYYKNIFKDGSPIGLVVLSYNDEYFMSDENEFNIVRILNIIKNLM